MSSSMPAAFHRADVLREMTESWDAFVSRRARLRDDQLTGPTDAAGWTGKDHLMHLVCWGNAAYDLVEGVPRYRSFWIPPDLDRAGDTDAINAMLQERYRAVPLTRVDLYLAVMRRRTTRAMETLSPDVVMRPRGWFDPDGAPHQLHQPILRFLVYTQTGHLQDHMDYIESLLDT